MIKVRVLSKLSFNLPPQFQKVEKDEDIILIDVLEKNNFNMNVPTIIIAETSEFIAESGADDYLIWPFSEKELAIRIQVCLAKHRAKPSNINSTNIDGLTGLYNKNYFYSCYKKHLTAPLSILMIDLDNFKNINDTHGHLNGDLALKEAAEIFKHSIRNSDILARFGGDEFILMLPETNLEGAYIVGERIRKAMEKKYPVSIGVAALELNNSLEELINNADKALYRAKKQGKNMVMKF